MDINQSRNNELALFRQSAALLVAGILLVNVATSSQIVIAGLFLCCASAFFMVVACIQIFPKVEQFTEVIRSLGDNLTFLFIIISIMSILIQWVEIKNTGGIHMLAGNISPVLQNWREFLMTSTVLLCFVLLYLLIFIIVSCVRIYRNHKDSVKKYGIPRTLLGYIPTVFFILGLLGITNIDITSHIIWFYLSALVSVLTIAYIGRKIYITRRSHMDDKNKARKSAIAVSEMAKLIGDLLTLGYPSENLKVILNVPMKQLEDELRDLKAYINALK